MPGSVEAEKTSRLLFWSQKCKAKDLSCCLIVELGGLPEVTRPAGRFRLPVAQVRKDLRIPPIR